MTKFIPQAGTAAKIAAAGLLLAFAVDASAQVIVRRPVVVERPIVVQRPVVVSRPVVVRHRYRHHHGRVIVREPVIIRR